MANQILVAGGRLEPCRDLPEPFVSDRLRGTTMSMASFPLGQPHDPGHPIAENLAGPPPRGFTGDHRHHRRGREQPCGLARSRTPPETVANCGNPDDEVTKRLLRRVQHPQTIGRREPSRRPTAALGRGSVPEPPPRGLAYPSPPATMGCEGVRPPTELGEGSALSSMDSQPVTGAVDGADRREDVGQHLLRTCRAPNPASSAVLRA